MSRVAWAFLSFGVASCFVPQSNLVPTRKINRFAVIPIFLELALGNGEIANVELNDATDVDREARRISKEYFGSDAAIAEEIRMVFKTRWSEHTPHPVYNGPIPEGGIVEDVIAAVELSESGLVLEVGKSVVAPGAGLGLFVRIADVESVCLDQGAVFCGYAVGSMHPGGDQGCGKSVKFHPSESGEGAVWFESQLRPLRDVLGLPDVKNLAGYSIHENGGAMKIVPLEENGPRFFIPDAKQPEPLSIMALGMMANDLAVDKLCTGENYKERSKRSNILVLVQRIERNPDMPTEVRPSRPVSTIARGVRFENKVPMEIGCEYGWRYWGGVGA